MDNLRHNVYKMNKDELEMYSFMLHDSLTSLYKITESLRAENKDLKEKIKILEETKARHAKMCFAISVLSEQGGVNNG